jgi:hypothetical protein
VKVLAVSIGRFPDADPDPPAEDPVHLRDHPFRLFKVPFLAERVVKGDEQDYPEGVRPEIAPAVGPDAPLAHPPESREDLGNVAAHLRGVSHGRYSPNG